MTKRLELYVEAKISISFYPEEFEGSDMTFEEFFDKILSDLRYKKNIFTDCILDFSRDIMEDVVDQVENNSLPIIVQIEKNNKKIPETVRDFE